MRLQKLLAAAGLGSRRSVEQWIRDGRVTVGGRVAQLGDRAGPDDEILLDGRKIDVRAAKTPSRDLLLYHKPVGEMTTRSDPQGRPTVFERLPEPHNGRWITVGRLDVNTSGLLLFTTDGELAHRLMHPSSEIEREYRVRVRGRPSQSALKQLLHGVMLEDGPARFDSIVQEPTDGSHTDFRVILHEGRNREVRRIWSAIGFEVSRLMRIRYGPVSLPRDLQAGAWRLADPEITAQLAGAVQLKTP